MRAHVREEASEARANCSERNPEPRERPSEHSSTKSRPSSAARGHACSGRELWEKCFPAAMEHLDAGKLVAMVRAAASDPQAADRAMQELERRSGRDEAISVDVEGLRDSYDAFQCANGVKMHAWETVPAAAASSAAASSAWAMAVDQGQRAGRIAETGTASKASATSAAHRPYLDALMKVPPPSQRPQRDRRPPARLQGFVFGARPSQQAKRKQAKEASPIKSHKRAKEEAKAKEAAQKKRSQSESLEAAPAKRVKAKEAAQTATVERQVTRAEARAAAKARAAERKCAGDAFKADLEETLEDIAAEKKALGQVAIDDELGAEEGGSSDDLKGREAIKHAVNSDVILAEVRHIPTELHPDSCVEADIDDAGHTALSEFCGEVDAVIQAAIRLCPGLRHLLGRLRSAAAQADAWLLSVGSDCVLHVERTGDPTVMVDWAAFDFENFDAEVYAAQARRALRNAAANDSYIFFEAQGASLGRFGVRRRAAAAAAGPHCQHDCETDIWNLCVELLAAGREMDQRVRSSALIGLRKSRAGCFREMGGAEELETAVAKLARRARAALSVSRELVRGSCPPEIWRATSASSGPYRSHQRRGTIVYRSKVSPERLVWLRHVEGKRWRFGVGVATNMPYWVDGPRDATADSARPTKARPDNRLFVAARAGAALQLPRGESLKRAGVTVGDADIAAFASRVDQNLQLRQRLHDRLDASRARQRTAGTNRTSHVRDAPLQTSFVVGARAELRPDVLQQLCDEARNFAAARRAALDVNQACHQLQGEVLQHTRARLSTETQLEDSAPGKVLLAADKLFDAVQGLAEELADGEGQAIPLEDLVGRLQMTVEAVREVICADAGAVALVALPKLSLSTSTKAVADLLAEPVASCAQVWALFERQLQAAIGRWLGKASEVGRLFQGGVASDPDAATEAAEAAATEASAMFHGTCSRTDDSATPAAAAPPVTGPSASAAPQAPRARKATSQPASTADLIDAAVVRAGEVLERIGVCEGARATACGAVRCAFENARRDLAWMAAEVVNICDGFLGIGVGDGETVRIQVAKRAGTLVMARMTTSLLCELGLPWRAASTTLYSEESSGMSFTCAVDSRPAKLEDMRSSWNRAVGAARYLIDKKATAKQPRPPAREAEGPRTASARRFPLTTESAKAIARVAHRQRGEECGRVKLVIGPAHGAVQLILPLLEHLRAKPARTDARTKVADAARRAAHALRRTTSIHLNLRDLPRREMDRSQTPEYAFMQDIFPTAAGAAMSASRLPSSVWENLKATAASSAAQRRDKESDDAPSAQEAWTIPNINNRGLDEDYAAGKPSEDCGSIRVLVRGTGGGQDTMRAGFWEAHDERREVYVVGVEGVLLYEARAPEPDDARSNAKRSRRKAQAPDRIYFNKKRGGSPRGLRVVIPPHHQARLKSITLQNLHPARKPRLQLFFKMTACKRPQSLPPREPQSLPQSLPQEGCSREPQSLPPRESQKGRALPATQAPAAQSAPCDGPRPPCAPRRRSPDEPQVARLTTQAGAAAEGGSAPPYNEELESVATLTADETAILRERRIVQRHGGASRKQWTRLEQRLRDILDAQRQRGSGHWHALDPRRKIGKATPESFGFRTSARFFEVRDLLSDGDRAKHMEQWSKLFPNGIGGLYNNLATCDPGSRTFTTIYAPADAVLIRVGDGFSGWIHKKYTTRAQKLQGLAARAKHAGNDVQARALERRHRRVVAQRTKRVNALHKTAARLICGLFDAFVLPILQTGAMSRKSEKRKLQSRQVGGMMSLAHARFNDHLHRLCNSPLSSCRLFLGASEWGTSRVCGCCGHWKADLGGEKTYRCNNPACGAVLERDGDAARCILIRFLLMDLTPGERKAAGLQP